MPKSYGKLFERLVSWENMIKAYAGARKNKKKSADLMSVHERYDEILSELRSGLISGAWRPRAYNCFVTRAEGKRRNIQAPDFRDRIVQRAIVQTLEPLYEKKFIYDSYSCRVGKGSHAAARRARQFLQLASGRWNKRYALKGDVSKFFPSISHHILFDIVHETVREARMMEVIERACVTPDNLSGRGIPIGALTSQLFSNVYLDKLDHFIKECVGAKYYLRYADDFVVIGHDSKWLSEALADIKWFLDTQLWLKLNPKTGISSASQGVDICGYRIWPTHSLPRKRVVKAAKSRLLRLIGKFFNGEAERVQIRQSLASFLGYVSHCNARKTTRSLISALRERWRRGIARKDSDNF